METYSLLRQFADSWMLLFLFLFFVGVIIWAFRPGSTKAYEDTANIPFRNADKPATESAAQSEAQK
ncbi:MULTISPECIES: cbb3-type cytochrome c oxidase subunit 3 [Tritonibacter]|uniref:Cbb3-type cytochrome c oxidase subunit 3 n=1 Tax=Tritonibacter scottomollicae TaxID=483013 RepID=A0A2T1AMS9_TRISK|nr:cbb3-type cytochrome c oxidase subunit 3 [Tritonibacter scottomollicae]PRZ49921.1 cytochrome c oxidase cbb3-type subunit 4 [Tritonibacter scottomollicae]WOI31932.1 cbb3-type cytochrome c oxidase subunit 3 [Tritonibacter scottomollicae]